MQLFNKSGSMTCDFYLNLIFTGIIRQVKYLSQSHILGKNRAYNFVIDAGTGTTAIGFALGALLFGYDFNLRVNIMLCFL